MPAVAQEPSIAPSTQNFRPADPLNPTAFDRFYNLDYDRAVPDLQRVLERHPDDPFAVNHLLIAIIFRELYRMGAMNTGEYANDSFIGQAHRPADPKVKQQIQGLVERAEKLENSVSRQTRMMWMPSTHEAPRGRNLPRTPRSSSGRGFQLCVMPWVRVTITKKYLN